jgi:hypothetical protein
MPRFYFHLSNSDEFFSDTIGTNVSDLAAAHFRALQLADRVISFSGLADREPDWRRWAVHVTDQMQHPVVTLIFSACLMAEKRIAITKVEGARALQQHLDEMLCDGSTSVDVSRRECA